MPHLPLHIAAFENVRIRFFRSPRLDADLPWVVLDDLQQALGMTNAQRQIFLQRVQEWTGIPQAIATEDGILVLIPHFMAQGLLEAVEGEDQDGPVSKIYYREGRKALEVLASHVHPANRRGFMLAAMLNHGE